MVVAVAAAMPRLLRGTCRHWLATRRGTALTAPFPPPVHNIGTKGGGGVTHYSPHPKSRVEPNSIKVSKHQNIKQETMGALLHKVDSKSTKYKGKQAPGKRVTSVICSTKPPLASMRAFSSFNSRNIDNF